jgi:hypothetical protein
MRKTKNQWPNHFSERWRCFVTGLEDIQVGEMVEFVVKA